MNDEQKNTILSNFGGLVENTICNPDFLAVFKQKHILTTVDCENIKTQQGQAAEATRFYNIIQTRTGAFEVLLDALETTFQTGAHQLLLTKINMNEQQTTIDNSDILPMELDLEPPKNNQDQERLIELSHTPVGNSSQNSICKQKQLWWTVLLPLCGVGMLLVVTVLLILHSIHTYDTAKIDLFSKNANNSQIIAILNPEDLQKNQSEICKSDIHTTLKLNINDPIEWRKKGFSCGHKIKALNFLGHPSLLLVYDIIRQTPNIEKLVIDAANVYPSDINLQFLESLSLTKLKHLQILSIFGKIENEHENWKLLFLFGRKFKFTNIKSLHVHGLTLSLRTRIELSNLITMNKLSLKSIRITDILFSNQVLDFYSHEVNYLELHVSPNSSTELAQTSLIKVLQNSVSIASVQTNIYVHGNLSRLFKYFKSQTVKTAKFGVHVDTDSPRLDLSCVAAAFANLDEIQVELYKGNPRVKIAIAGLDQNSDNMLNLVIKSNFKMVLRYPIHDHCQNLHINSNLVKITTNATCVH